MPNPTADEGPMKFADDRPYADPEKAARKLVEIANNVETIQDGRIYIEEINRPFLYEFKGSPAEYKAGLDRLIAKGLGPDGRGRGRPETHYGTCEPAKACASAVSRSLA